MRIYNIKQVKYKYNNDENNYTIIGNKTNFVKFKKIFNNNDSSNKNKIEM